MDLQRTCRAGREVDGVQKWFGASPPFAHPRGGSGSRLQRVDETLRLDPIGLGILALQIDPGSTVRAEAPCRIERGRVEHHGRKPGVTVVAERLMCPQIARQTLKPGVVTRPLGILAVRRAEGGEADPA